MAAPMSVFDIAGRAMSAQIVRLNTVASNMANAGTVSSTKEGAYRALKPATEPTKRHDPSNPLANKDGDVWDAGVDSAAELVDMIETQRQYQNNVQVMQTAKTLTLDTLRIEK